MAFSLGLRSERAYESASGQVKGLLRTQAGILPGTDPEEILEEAISLALVDLGSSFI
jgi:hypothetical protein